MSKFGKVLRELREKRGLSVNQLALYSGVSSSLISKIENGLRKSPKPATIEKLAKGLKIKYEELMILAGHIDSDEISETLIQGSGDQTTDAKLRFFEELENDFGIDLTDPNAQKMLKRVVKVIFADEDEGDAN